ncbi:phage tail protein [Providencia rettgeri]|uniref:phage tail-collar fiber domain-containing protein n=1 Tax=Providencia rettgeri TaxID=587 RepID=UPI00244820D3|nr:phage tail protein [Providencia rettgeri]MDH2395607.1 phage tail protein [Providencia rettgeri]
MKYFALLTKLGENLLAQATALGTKLELTHMAVGDGGGKLPTPDTNQTKLIAEKRRAAINTLFIDDKNKNQIIAEQIIPEAEGGWWIREIGLFDKTGNLIAVANCPETYKPQLAEGSGRTQAIRMILVVSHTESVTLKIDPSVVLATRKYVDDLITALDIKLQKQIDNKVNKAGDSVTGTLKFNGVAPLAYDIESLTGNKDEIANYLRKFRYLYNSTIFHEIVTKDGIQIATGTEPTNLIYSLSSSGSLILKGRVIPTDFLDFNQRYLGINNPAIAAKKLDKPSRIAGHTFQGQGEDIKITPADIGAQPAGSYVSPKELNDELSKKLDKTGGQITKNDQALAIKLASANQANYIGFLDASGYRRGLIGYGNTTDDFVVSNTRSGITLKLTADGKALIGSAEIMKAGDSGFGGSAVLAMTDDLKKETVTKVFKQGGGTGNNIFSGHGAGINFAYTSQIRMGLFIKSNGDTRIYTSRDDTDAGELKMTKLYSEVNTKTDRNGNLKVSNASDALSDYPVGSPIPWPQATAPTGFLVCNGQTFNKTTYPLLATTYPSGKLPDLRGEFIRGLDAGRNIDSSRTVLSAQGDAIRNITGEFAMNGEGNMPDNKSGWATGAFKKNLTGLKSHTEQSLGGISYTFDASRVVPTANENRPRNIAFLYIVRAA